MTSESDSGGVEVSLRNGGSMLVRPIRPADKALIRAGFERLSDESRYRRFLSPTPRLSEQMLRYLTEVDHESHEALIATESTSGEGIGVARYVRTDDPKAAEVAVTVVDDWHGRGVATALLELLAARARESGIEKFTALLLASNEEMVDLLERLGPTTVERAAAGRMQLESDIPDVGVDPAIRSLLRRCADERSSVEPARTLATGSGVGDPD
ncbi:MAG: GNAT family N-acetyltransferase [Solirubrobacterales bacterium]